MSSARGGAPPIFPVDEKFDGTNWITWNENILIAARMRGAYGYLTGTIKKLIPTLTTPTITTQPATTSIGKETIPLVPVSITPAPTKTRW